MKKFLVFFVVFFSMHWRPANCQILRLDSTRFITGDKPYTGIDYTIPTSDKGIFFAGWTTNDAGGIIPYSPYRRINVLVGKIDSFRQISWIKQYGGNEEEGAGPSVQTSDGGYAVLAVTLSNDGDVTGFKGATDIWLLRLDAGGNLLWQKTYGSSQGDGAISIASTPDNGFIIFGTSNGNNNDVPFHYGSAWSSDWLVIKTDSMGNVQWSKTIGGLGEEGSDGSILSIDSNYYLVSWSNSRDNDCTDTMWHAGVTFPYENYYVLKLDKNGNVLWNKSYGGSGGDGAKQAIFNKRDSSIVINGYTMSSDYMITGSFGCSNVDMWVIKIDVSGNLIWQKILGSIQREEGRGICHSQNEGYIVYGETFPSPCDDTSMENIGLQDCLLFELDTAGNTVFRKIFGGLNYESCRSIIPYLNGYAASGESMSAKFSEGLTNEWSATGQGAFISYLRYSNVAIQNVNEPEYHEIAVFPNPAQEVIKVVTPENNGIVSIINSLGQAHYSANAGNLNNELIIDISLWDAGLYCLIWKGEKGGVQRAKFIKN